MRYSIMLQLVGIITLILVGTAGLFAWLQNREISPSSEGTFHGTSVQKPSRRASPFVRTSNE
jgi:hypothetical protein